MAPTYAQTENTLCIDREATTVVMDFEPCEFRFEHTVAKTLFSHSHTQDYRHFLSSPELKRISGERRGTRGLWLMPWSWTRNVGPNGERKQMFNITFGHFKVRKSTSTAHDTHLSLFVSKRSLHSTRSMSNYPMFRMSCANRVSQRLERLLPKTSARNWQLWWHILWAEYGFIVVYSTCWWVLQLVVYMDAPKSFWSLSESPVNSSSRVFGNFAYVPDSRVTYIAFHVLIACAELGEQLRAGAWKSLISFFYWLSGDLPSWI